MSDVVLSEDQKAKVEQNIYLAKYFYNKYRYPAGVDADDWKQEVFMTLCLAVARHDETKGTLSTLFSNMLLSSWHTAKWYYNRHSRIKTLDENNGSISLLIEQSEPIEDSRDEIRSLVEDFGEKWRIACVNALDAAVFSAEDAKVVDSIRSQFGGIGSVSRCDHCCSIFVAKNRMGRTKYCAPCKRIVRRMNCASAKIANSRRSEK